jgi:hypothetical protein
MECGSTGVSGTGFTVCGKTLIFVIPRRVARRGISLFLRLNQGEIPHFVRNDKINYFFRSLFSLSGFVLRRWTTTYRVMPVLPEKISSVDI